MIRKILIGILTVILLAIIVLVIGNSSMKKLYVEEQKIMVNKDAKLDKQVITEDMLTDLPIPLQNYLHFTGFIGQEMPMNAEVIWRDSEIKLSPDAGWMKLRTYQYNSVESPKRLAYMKGRMFGIPIEVREAVRGNHGNMLGKISGLFTIFNNSDSETVESGLFTILAEAPFVPGYIFADYITWEEIDEFTAIGRLQYGDFDITGTFFFNEKGEYISFVTQDRNYEKPDGGYEKKKWSVEVSDYREMEGLMVPTIVSATWHLQEGEYKYWEGTISHVHFNKD